MHRVRAHPLPALPALVLLLLLPACGIGPRLRIPSPLNSVPGKDPTLSRWLEAARDRLQQRDERGALDGVEKILRSHPDDVNTHRLRQDILRQRGRVGRILSEAEARLAKEPRRATYHYLRGRIEDTDRGKREAFERCVKLDPANFWGWYGLAFTLRAESNQAANAIYEYLYRQANGDLRTGIAYAASLGRGGQSAEAFRIYGEIAKSNPGLGSLGMSETLVRSGKSKQAWRHLLVALRERPFDVGVRGVAATLLSHGLPEDGIQELLDVLRADPERLQQFAKTGSSLLAAMFEYVGEPAAALQVLRAASPLAEADRRRFRRLLISIDGVAAFLADVRAGTVQQFLDDERNQVRGRWQAFLTGPWMHHADPLGDRGRSVALIRAMIRVGLLQYADLVCAQALLRYDAAPELLELQVEVRKEIAFESGLRRIITRGYGRFAQDGEAGTLGGILDEIRALSKRVLGKDVVGKPELFRLPFVGILVNSLGAGLPAHLAHYNKHLVMGQRSGRPTEGMILTQLSRRLIDPVRAVPLPPRTIEVIGEHRELEPLEQVDLAGIALLNHYVIDMDEVRAWAQGIADRRRIIREDGGVALRDPLPERVSPMHPAGVEWRLSVLSPVEDKDLDLAVLDIIRWHERGHMVDFLHFLPVTVHPLRSLALALRNGLSALGIASEMEGRAELAALAMSPHTRLVLAHITGFLVGEGGESPHAHGFRVLVGEILAELQRRGVQECDVRYWHRVDPHTVREVARQLLTRLW